MAPFAQITSGPATATGQNPNHEALIFDRTNNIVEAVGDNGLAQALQSALYVLTAQTALTTITTAQNLINKTLGAGVLNKLLRTVDIIGNMIFTTANTGTIVLTLSLGGVPICVLTVPSTTAGSNQQLQFEFTLTTASTGASGTVEAHGNVSANVTAAANGLVSQYCDPNTAVSGSINLGSALALTLTIAGSAAIASAQLRQTVIQVLN